MWVVMLPGCCCCWRPLQMIRFMVRTWCWLARGCTNPIWEDQIPLAVRQLPLEAIWQCGKEAKETNALLGKQKCRQQQPDRSADLPQVHMNTVSSKGEVR